MNEPWILTRTGLEGDTYRYYYTKHKYEGEQWIPIGSEVEGANIPEGETKHASKRTASRKEGLSTDYGLESLKKSDFFQADGKTQKPIGEIIALIKQHKPYDPESGITEDKYNSDIYNKVKDFLPKLQGISKEEKGFLAKEREFAERGAEMGREADVYGLQKEAGKVGTQMRGAYGGMGGGMRGAIGGQATMGKGLGQAYDKYGLGMEKAAFAEEKGLYGEEQKQEAEFEGDISTFLTNFKQGGRVPDKESFSNFLTQLPDAGGS